VNDRPVLLGRIVGVFGVEGWVKVHSYTEPRENILRYRPWRLRQGDVERVIEQPRGRVQGKGLAAKLPGIDDRDAAAALAGSEIWIARAALPKPKRGEYYWTDLEGLEVVAADGTALGRVSHLFATGANDVLVVRGERERLIPFLPGAVVKDVDLDAGTIRVEWDPEF
jgi:16S rRNA processing protein RimM